jgi:DNA-binding NarL/FixJ family response regulator
MYCVVCMTCDPASLTVVLGRFDQLVRRGLADALREDPRVRIIASDLHDAALEEVVAREAPRVLILDEAVEDSLLARLKASQPHIGVLVLAGSSTRLYRTLLRSVGAGFLSPSASTTEILAAVDIAARRQQSATDGQSHTPGPGNPRGAERLTPREREVFWCLCRGMSYEAIAVILGIAPETVRTHTRRVCRKLEVPGKRSLIGLDPDRESASSG